MCGIVGFFRNKDSINSTLKCLEVLKNRGKDGYGIVTDEDLIVDDTLVALRERSKDIRAKHTVGHCLHSVVSKILQPFIGRDTYFSANCEIYNWKQLNQKYKLNAQNDAELLFYLLEQAYDKDKLKNLKTLLNELDGVYAFCYKKGDEVYLVRDIIGVKPIWYSHTSGFSFASEKKALESVNILDIHELTPRKIALYNVVTDKLNFIERDFFSATPLNTKSKKDIEKELIGLITNSISKRIPDKPFGILFSGGIDSTFLAFVCKQLGLKPTLYTAALSEPGMEEASDLKYSKKIAKALGLDLKIKTVTVKDVEKYLKTIIPLIEDTKVTKVSVALTLFLALESAKKDKIKVIFSGLGSEEIFAGYDRHKKSYDINKECISGLLKLYERDTYRDDTISMFNSVEIRLPFLDKSLVDYSLKIPAKYKIKDDQTKVILRDIAKNLGLDPEFANRKKVAAQYGSKILRAIQKLTKQSPHKYKSEYLKKFYPQKNLKLGALISTGKDSLFAAHVMKQQNYELTCAISVYSENTASYMFHTPNIKLVKLQAEAMQIPLVAVETKGEKEKELDDLKKAMKQAKAEYNIDGIITGALYSTYQRDRIEKLADSLGLKIFSPLWHINQETEMRELVRQGFKVIISSVAAYGLNKDDLGKEIDKDFIDKMVKLNEKVGINIAGEGGEFESLVLDCPLFEKKIEIVDAETIVENENTGLYLINESKLVSK
ncbi:MAG: diphthine--ammonia ligase [Nanoarchaeota archaeon]|nr:diphthine--ammonia ligase [Nanoarchaeota archaeon]